MIVVISRSPEVHLKFEIRYDHDLFPSFVTRNPNNESLFKVSHFKGNRCQDNFLLIAFSLHSIQILAENTNWKQIIPTFHAFSILISISFKRRKRQDIYSEQNYNLRAFSDYHWDKSGIATLLYSQYGRWTYHSPREIGGILSLGKVLKTGSPYNVPVTQPGWSFINSRSVSLNLRSCFK